MSTVASEPALARPVPALQLSIAGAGLLGRLLGWQLTERGHEVTLYERGDPGSRSSAGWVAAAMLAPYGELPDAEASVFERGEAGLSSWRYWLRELGVPHGFDGAIAVAHHADRKLLDKFARTIDGRKPNRLQALSSERLRTLEPALAERFDRGVYLPAEGWLDNRALFDALETRCGTIHYHSAVEPRSADRRLCHRLPRHRGIRRGARAARRARRGAASAGARGSPDTARASDAPALSALYCTAR